MKNSQNNDVLQFRTTLRQNLHIFRASVAANFHPDEATEYYGNIMYTSIWKIIAPNFKSSAQLKYVMWLLGITKLLKVTTVCTDYVHQIHDCCSAAI